MSEGTLDVSQGNAQQNVNADSTDGQQQQIDPKVDLEKQLEEARQEAYRLRTERREAEKAANKRVEELQRKKAALQTKLRQLEGKTGTSDQQDPQKDTVETIEKLKEEIAKEKRRAAMAIPLANAAATKHVPVEYLTDFIDALGYEPEVDELSGHIEDAVEEFSAIITEYAPHFGFVKKEDLGEGNTAEDTSTEQLEDVALAQKKRSPADSQGNIPAMSRATQAEHELRAAFEQVQKFRTSPDRAGMNRAQANYENVKRRILQMEGGGAIVQRFVAGLNFKAPQR